MRLFIDLLFLEYEILWLTLELRTIFSYGLYKKLLFDIL